MIIFLLKYAKKTDLWFHTKRHSWRSWNFNNDRWKATKKKRILIKDVLKLPLIIVKPDFLQMFTMEIL